MLPSEFIALLNGPKYCPCCGYSIDHEGYCDDCEGYSAPALASELPEPPPTRCFVL
ncbi:MAG: hypothetical protein WC627_12010 [Legionella sp.]|jgi:hypothetical protein